MRAPAVLFLVVASSCASPLPAPTNAVVAVASNAPIAPPPARAPEPARFSPRMAYGDGYGCVRERSTIRCTGAFLSFQGTPLRSLDHVREIGVGEHHACAILDDGAITCWGSNESGQLGDGTNTPRYEPRIVVDLPAAVQIAVGHRTMCALFVDDSVRCWGGITGTKIPKVVSFGGIVKSLGVSFTDACAILDDTTVSCVGRKGAPQKIEGLRDVAQIAIGTTSAALRRDGTVWWWEGIGAPKQLRGVDHVVQISGVSYHACARHEDRHVSCWHQRDETAKVANDLRDVDEIAVTYGGGVCGMLRDGQQKCVDAPASAEENGDADAQAR